MSRRRQRVVVSAALYSGIVFFLEQFFTTFVIAYAILAIAVRSLIHGELPSAITKEEDSSDAAAAAQDDEAASRELLVKLAASRAERAILREKVHEALRRLERLADGAGR